MLGVHERCLQPAEAYPAFWRRSRLSPKVQRNNFLLLSSPLTTALGTWKKRRPDLWMLLSWRERVLVSLVTKVFLRRNPATPMDRGEGPVSTHCGRFSHDTRWTAVDPQQPPTRKLGQHLSVGRANIVRLVDG